MSNHLHLVVHMSAEASNEWTAEEVAARWGENGRFGGTAAKAVERRAARPPAGTIQMTGVAIRKINSSGHDLGGLEPGARQYCRRH